MAVTSIGQARREIGQREPKHEKSRELSVCPSLAVEKVVAIKQQNWKPGTLKSVFKD